MLDGAAALDDLKSPPGNKLEKLRGLGVAYILLNGGGPAHDSLRRFARELMPAFADEAKARVVGK